MLIPEPPMLADPGMDIGLPTKPSLSVGLYLLTGRLFPDIGLAALGMILNPFIHCFASMTDDVMLTHLLSGLFFLSPFQARLSHFPVLQHGSKAYDLCSLQSVLV